MIEDVGEDMAEDGNHNDKKRRREQSVDMMDESVGVFSPIRGNLDVSRTPGTQSRGFQDRKTKSMETLRASDGATLQESTLGATGPRGSEEYHTAVSVTYTVEEEKKGNISGQKPKIAFEREEEVVRKSGVGMKIKMDQSEVLVQFEK